MGEFRIGRRNAQHSYPESRRGGGSLSSGGSNFAIGPLDQELVPIVGLEVPWAAISSGAPPGTDVPVTLSVTGRLLLWGVVCLKNNTADDLQVTVTVRVDGTDLVNEFSTLVGDGAVTIPFTIETDAISLGTHQASVNVACGVDGAMSLGSETCTIKLQEVAAPTG